MAIYNQKINCRGKYSYVATYQEFIYDIAS